MHHRFSGSVEISYLESFSGCGVDLASFFLVGVFSAYVKAHVNRVSITVNLLIWGWVSSHIYSGDLLDVIV